MLQSFFSKIYTSTFHLPCLRQNASCRQAHVVFRNAIPRRHFLRYLLGFFLFSFFPFRVRETWADSSLSLNTKKDSIGQFFDGEELIYDGGFWLFKRVAVGKLTFTKLEEKGRYLAILEGETLGILGWVARYRTDTYRSIMEEVDGGKRLRSVSFEEDVKIGDRRKRRMHLFDYQNRKWVQLTQRYDRPQVREETEIPPGMTYDDFITGFYNFRYGTYGEIERGRNYTVPTFPKKGPTSFKIWIASKDEEARERKSLKSKEDREYMIRVYIGPEITRSKKGVIEGWLSKDLVPMEGKIRDVVLYGDVRARLVKKIKAEN